MACVRYFARWPTRLPASAFSLTCARIAAVACERLITSKVTDLLPVREPSDTTSVTVCEPSPKSLLASTPVAKGVGAPWTYHEYCNGSFSGSDDKAPSKSTVAFEPPTE